MTSLCRRPLPKNALPLARYIIASTNRSTAIMKLISAMEYLLANGADKTKTGDAALHVLAKAIGRVGGVE